MRELVGPTFVAALGAAALAAKGLIVPVSMFDAGINASAGTFILHGLVPYRDFWMLYGPLGGYLAALVSVVSPLQRDDHSASTITPVIDAVGRQG
jgi:hypothetical protein